jgi:hypothetical protein
MADLFKSLPKIEKMNRLEMLLLFIFVVYLIFPIGTPSILKDYIISPMGYVTIFIVTLYLFFYSHPILAILYIFVAYELLNRSNKASMQQVQHVHNTINKNKQVRFNEQPAKVDEKVVSVAPKQSTTLEEEIINKNAPVGVSQGTNFVITGFQPITDKIGSASNYM